MDIIFVSIGLGNLFAIFQRAMDTILSRVQWKPFLIYRDEVVIFSKDERQHLNDICIERNSTRLEADRTIRSII